MDALQLLGQYKSIIVPAPSGGVSAADFVNRGDIHGFYFADAAVDEHVAIVWACDYFRAAKLPSQAIAAGAKLYWDTSEDHATTVSAGNHLVGYAILPAAATTTEVDMVLWGLA